jgi:hypothetical protein
MPLVLHLPPLKLSLQFNQLQVVSVAAQRLEGGRRNTLRRLLQGESCLARVPPVGHAALDDAAELPRLTCGPQRLWGRGGGGMKRNTPGAHMRIQREQLPPASLAVRSDCGEGTEGR